MILLSACAFQLSPATCAVVGGDLLEHIGERACVDLLAPVDSHYSSGFVGVSARNDALRIGDDAPVV